MEPGAVELSEPFVWVVVDMPAPGVDKPVPTLVPMPVPTPVWANANPDRPSVVANIALNANLRFMIYSLEVG